MSSFDVAETEHRKNRELITFTVVDAAEVRGKDETVDRILSYVEDKTGSARLFPKRSDIRPADMKDLLPDICFFVPVHDDNGELEDVHIPLMGTNVVRFYGELTGRGVRSHPNAQVSSRILATVSQILKDRCPALAESKVLSSDKQHLAVRALYVPMSEDGQNIDRLFVYLRVFVNSLLEDSERPAQ